MTASDADALNITGAQVQAAPGRGAKASSSRRLADWDQSFLPPEEADELTPELLELRNRLGVYEDDFEDLVDDGAGAGAEAGEARPPTKQAGFSIEITPFYGGEGEGEGEGGVDI